ncbi:sporulation-delaying protein SdpB [Weeksella virosa]|uniref:sporulation-delaying protein SdpB family protein n=1 Tax=Weeksella virosa TaxID=1014 RepID=UPI0025535327|nr:sporulation-delaying protein SdpB family protein [Weeksella virosa]MDK7375601.1 sporulation-delaying protein SdpB [Weeksella virosa]
MNSIFKYFEKKIDSGVYWTNYLGLGRSLLALGLLLTLVFNSNDVLFSYGINNQDFLKCNGINRISLYCLLDNVVLTKSISIAVLLLVIIGVYPRFTCILHWWVAYSFATSSYIVDGGDQIGSILTFFLIPICLLDKRKFHWNRINFKPTFIEKNIAFFSYLIIAVQASIIYFHACVGKFVIDEWVNGTAVYYWVTNSVFGINDNLLFLVNPLFKSPLIMLLITWGVLLLELFLAVNIFLTNKKVKFLSLFLGIAFHFLIIVAHGLVSFFFSMTSLLIIYLISKNYNYVTNRNN